MRSNTPIPRLFLRGRAFHFTIVLAGLLMGVPPALATTFYVKPGGSDSNAGTSLLAAWGSLNKANSALRAGDVCIFAAGSYTGSINPSTSGTATNRITYIGSLSNPSSTTVSGGIGLNKSYVTVKGFKASGGFGVDYPARNDSIAWCIGTGIGFGAGKYSMIARNTVNGGVHFNANAGLACYDHAVLDPACMAAAEFDTIRQNTINLGTIYPGDRAWSFHGFAQTALIDSNKISGLLTIGGPYPTESAIVMCSYNSYYITFRDNRWDIEATDVHPQDTYRAITMRDSSRYFTFERDTMNLSVQGGYRIHIQVANSGNWPGSTGYNTWKNCVYKLGGGDFGSQDKFLNNTMDNNVIASNDGHAFNPLGFVVDSKFRHNTFYSGGQTIRFDDQLQGSNEFTSNLVYSRNAGAPSATGGLAMWMQNTTNLTSDYNVFFAPTYSSTPGDRSLAWCCYGSSKPGAGQGWNTKTGQDSHSRYGSPRLADSTFATLNARPTAGSAVIGAGMGGTDAGAIPFGTVVDGTAPSAVNLDTLNVYDKTITLRWTAPGDDGMTGTASAYDLRMSTSSITSANFSSATAVMPVPPVASAGTVQTYLIQNLTPGTTYYFAIKARDDVSNWSALGTIPRVTTRSADFVAPGSVQDLAAQ